MRIGWCILENDFVELREAIQLTHILWGGAYNPIIPVGDDTTLAEQLVSTFRVDYLVPISDHKIIKDFIDRFRYLPDPFLHKGIILDHGDGNKNTQALNIYHPIKHLFEEHFKSNPSPTFTAHLYDWHSDDPLSDVLLMTIGQYPDETITGTPYNKLVTEYLSGKTTQLLESDSVPPGLFNILSPNTLSRHDINLDPRGGSIVAKDGFYLGKIDDFFDLIHYWNLRAANNYILFYDSDYKDRFDECRSEFLKSLRSRPKGRLPIENHIGIWSKSSTDEDVKAEFTNSIICHRVGEHTWNGFNVRVPATYINETSVLANIPTDDNSKYFLVPLAEKPYFSDIVDHYSEHLIVSIDFGVRFSNNSDSTLNTPYLPQLNEYYGRNLHFKWNQVRVGIDGIGIIIDACDNDVSLKILGVFSLFEAIFKCANLKINQSTPGLIAKRIINQLGGYIQDCRILKITGVRALIERYKPDTSFKKAAALKIIGENNFEDFKSLFVKGKSVTSPHDIFNDLVKLLIFRSGIKLACDHCKLSFWCSIDDIKTVTICQYCGKEIHITPQIENDGWHYRRTGLFGKDNSQEGSIPAILTLLTLDTILHSHEMIYTTATEITPGDQPDEQCETDFICLTKDHRTNNVQIAIGECKTRNDIEEDDVDKLLSVAERLEALGLEVYIIFAKLCDFTQEEIDLCKKVNSQYKTRLILLTDKELEPYHLYDTTEGKDKFSRFTHDLEGIANVTRTLYSLDEKETPTQ